MHYLHVLISKVILPIRLLMLRRTDAFRNELFLRLMCHEEQRKQFPEYWDGVRQTSGPFILDVLNDEKMKNENDIGNRITLEDVVSHK